MKTMTITLLAALLLSLNAFAGKTKESVMVNGVCGMCKSRIEKAAKEAGAASASWSEDTHMLELTFSKKKTSLDKIQEKIAAVGHDTGNFKASDEVYNNLPGCCLYDRSGKTKPGQGKHH